MSKAASKRAALWTILGNLGIATLKLGGQNLVAAEGRLVSAVVSRQPRWSPDVQPAWRFSDFDRKRNVCRARDAT